MSDLEVRLLRALMSRKQSVEGSEPVEAYGMDLEDALMLDEPGTIVEPDVRKALLKYFKRMKMLEGAYLSRNTETHVTAQQIGKTMKITRRQLDQIIKEETQRLPEAALPRFKSGATYSDLPFRNSLQTAAEFVADAREILDNIGQDEIVDDLDNIMDKLVGMGIVF